MQLNPNELIRYSRQYHLDEIGIEGQLKLKNARVLCVGAGGLGSTVLLQLAAAGVGKIDIVDDDTIELSNLHRQILYKCEQIGYKKAFVAKQQLAALNPDIDIYAHTERLDINNAHQLISQSDIVVDCSDNFVTRYLINDICHELNKPYVFASVYQFKGQCALFSGRDGPCFCCLYPLTLNFVPDCNAGGVIGALPCLLGAIQAAEAIKWILRNDNLLRGFLLNIDILKMEFRKFKIMKNSECSVCFPEKNCNQIYSISAKKLQEKLKIDNNILLLDVRTNKEHAIFNLGGLLIPLQTLPYCLTALNPEKLIIVYCQSGQRSKQAVKLLIDANFNALSLEGGIVEWQREKSLG